MKEWGGFVFFYEMFLGFFVVLLGFILALIILSCCFNFLGRK